MIFAKDMNWGVHASERQAYILDNLRRKAFQPASYIVVPAPKPNMFEIYNSAMLLNPKFDSEDLLVVGIGYGYQDTLNLVRDMVMKKLSEDYTVEKEYAADLTDSVRDLMKEA